MPDRPARKIRDRSWPCRWLRVGLALLATGVIDQGKLLTLTTEKALQHGLADDRAERLDAVNARRRTGSRREVRRGMVLMTILGPCTALANDRSLLGEAHGT
ncbi:MAG TPA: hypothetical protein VD738_02940 [Nitrospira sp.]|nr:hypothetical protein [Nitrospira sp.]